MRRTLGTLALSAGIVVGFAGAASAQTSPCDSYSGTCVKGVKQVKRPTPNVGGTKLPFTGAEVTGLALAGALAVGGGTVLVAAGRRRTRAQAV